MEHEKNFKNNKKNNTDTCEIIFYPHGKKIKIPAGEKITDAAAIAGIIIPTPCGGNGLCGKCKVKVEGKMSGETLTQLACCTRILGDASVTLPTQWEDENLKILQDVSEISEIDGIKKAPIAYRVSEQGLGVAVDIGTTSVALCLMDLENKLFLDTASFLNPQTIRGDDIVSRISYCENNGGLKELQNILMRDINKTILDICARNGLLCEQITRFAIAANTVMQHIFLGISPSSIGQSPYTPAYLYHEPVSAKSLGLCANNAVVTLLPNVAGFVGSDIVAGAAAHGLARAEKIKLFIDIGTNNEIVLGNKDFLLCCAAAAGPALEGSRISCGMRACDGAIEKVRLIVGTPLAAPVPQLLENKKFDYSVIGDVAPRGICGSGLIDALAVFLDAQIIDKTGKILTSKPILLTEEKYGIYITQKDIREAQLALAAIRAATQIMLDEAKISAQDVDEVLLAGAFGNYLDVTSALKTGLLPPVLKIKCVKNAALKGACMSLSDENFFEEARYTAKKMRYIELAARCDFQSRFLEAMTFL